MSTDSRKQCCTQRLISNFIKLAIQILPNLAVIIKTWMWLTVRPTEVRKEEIDLLFQEGESMYVRAKERRSSSVDGEGWVDFGPHEVKEREEAGNFIC